MKTSTSLLTSPYTVVLLAMWLCLNSAKAQPADRAALPLVAVPGVQQVAPLGVKGTDDTNGGGGTQIGAVPLEVTVSSSKVASALKKLRAGDITPQQAWDNKALDVDDLIYFLEKGLDSWGGFFYKKDPELRRDLVALLVEHGGERLNKPEDLSPVVRLWLADYYGSIGDKRVLALSKSILSQMKPLKGENALGFQALERIAWFYRDQGKYEEGAQTWRLMMAYHQDTGWWQPDSLIEAARLYRRSGDNVEAKKLYDQVAKFGNSWMTQLSLWDQCVVLIDQGRYKEAQSLIERFSNDTKANLPPYVASLLQGKVAAKQDKWKEARIYYLQALKSYDNMPESLRLTENSVFYHSIQQGLEWSQTWMERSFVCDSPDMTVVVERNEEGTAGSSWDVHVHSPRLVKLIAECSDAHVSIKVDDQTKATFGYQTTISIEVHLKSSEDHVETEVRVFPEGHPEQVVKLPLFIEVK